MPTICVCNSSPAGLDPQQAHTQVNKHPESPFTSQSLPASVNYWLSATPKTQKAGGGGGGETLIKSSQLWKGLSSFRKAVKSYLNKKQAIILFINVYTLCNYYYFCACELCPLGSIFIVEILKKKKKEINDVSLAWVCNQPSRESVNTELLLTLHLVDQPWQQQRGVASGTLVELGMTEGSEVTGMGAGCGWAEWWRLEKKKKKCYT